MCIRTAVVGKQFTVKKEENNDHDCHTFSIIMNANTDREEIVGHILREHSRLFWNFIE